MFVNNYKIKHVEEAVCLRGEGEGGLEHGPDDVWDFFIPAYTKLSSKVQYFHEENLQISSKVLIQSILVDIRMICIPMHKLYVLKSGE